MNVVDVTSKPVSRTRIWALLFLLASLPTHLTRAAGPYEENEFYRLETIAIPNGLSFEVSGLALLPDGRLAAAIRKGEVWIIKIHDNATGSKPQFTRFASGLHEPLGLAWHNGALYTAQRTEVTRLADSNGDGIADVYETIATGWGVSGNYHEYCYGPVFDRNDDLWITLNSTLGQSVDPADRAWRGWSLNIRADGTWSPISGGFRSPSGIGLNGSGDLFATDQQGNWFGTCALVQILPGTFHGHADALEFCSLPGATFPHPGPLPRGLTVAEASRRVAAYKLPAVWFPYRKMGMSTTDLLYDTTEGAFGPFANQLFVGEFTMSQVSRVFLEKVQGEYQGACFPFRKGFQCAVFRLAWGADGSMFVGENNRGWNSLGTRAFGLQRLVWTGVTPFEIQEMRALPDGFELLFTAPLHPNTESGTDSIAMKSYTYRYHAAYGSEEIDTRDLSITKTSISEDRLRLALSIDGLREGYVHELRLPRMRSAQGIPLLHPEAYYTLNRIPISP